jgi:hypothetical protein
MTLELRKFHLIEIIMSATDEAMLSKYEESMRKARIEAYESQLKPMTIEEYRQRILKSEEDIKNGGLIDMEDLEKDMENW